MRWAVCCRWLVKAQGRSPARAAGRASARISLPMRPCSTLVHQALGPCSAQRPTPPLLSLPVLTPCVLCPPVHAPAGVSVAQRCAISLYRMSVNQGLARPQQHQHASSLRPAELSKAEARPGVSPDRWEVAGGRRRWLQRARKGRAHPEVAWGQQPCADLPQCCLAPSVSMPVCL